MYFDFNEKVMLNLGHVLKQREGCFGTDFVILNRGQMKRKTRKPPPTPLHTSNSHQRKIDRLSTSDVHQGHIHEGSFVESVFERGTLKFRSVSTCPPRPVP
ncbi:hypothetical protein AVEN_82749-1 [Araneus ventricosus]|uniref:Uncharacterized protein n=1 Tax=Araneus ventricosus TaxID=182803 RepID=A0A4Y2E924_ARAVE|nr:hypothetical protein AVEN_82749-1 [Araneus ventricosus]